MLSATSVNHVASLEAILRQYASKVTPKSIFFFNCFAANFVFIMAVLFHHFLIFFSSYISFLLLTFLIYFLISSLHIHKIKLKYLFSSFIICPVVWLSNIHRQLDFLLKLNINLQSQIGN